MCAVSVRGFWSDDAGGGTIMGLFWFAVLVAITGLAVDSTDGFRTRTMLQATADTAALAAAMDLPKRDAVAATAVAYASTNMQVDTNGSVLLPEDVTIGVWDEATRTFTPESRVAPGTKIDAVHLMLNRGAVNGNALPLNFLRIAGFQTWDVRAQAIAQRFVPGCLRDGLVAKLQVDISSNNAFTNEICLHGNKGVNMQSNNYFEEGTAVSMPDLAMLEAPSSAMSSNRGLKEALREDILSPRLVNHIDEILTSFLDPTPSPYLPAYINASKPLVTVRNVSKFDWSTLTAGRVYYFSCKSNQELLQIPQGAIVANVVIVADCVIQFGANSIALNAVIGSRAEMDLPSAADKAKVRERAAVTTASGVQLGLPDNCTPGGGVQLFSNGSMNFSSTTKFDGVQLVAGKDISLGARDQGINGISAQAGGNIYMTSNNMFGLCSGGTDVGMYGFWYYRLVL